MVRLVNRLLLIICMIATSASAQTVWWGYSLDKFRTVFRANERRDGGQHLCGRLHLEHVARRHGALGVDAREAGHTRGGRPSLHLLPRGASGRSGQDVRLDDREHEAGDEACGAGRRDVVQPGTPDRPRDRREERQQRDEPDEPEL